MIRCLIVISLFWCACLPAFASGALLWGQTTAALAPKSTDEAATAVFRFQNIGKQTLVISEVVPDCTCLTAPLQKTRYEPGESGQIEARFVIGRQTGSHTVTIQVRGREGEQVHSSVLVLQINIVDVVVFSPRFLYWKPDEPLEPKSVTITLLPGQPITLRDVKASNPAFTVQLSPTDDPRKFTLLVTPPAQRARSICPITAITESSDPAKTHEHGMVARLL